MQNKAMHNKTLRVGLIGLGKMGRNHLRVLSMLKGVELAFIADTDGDLAQKTAALHGTVGAADPTPLLNTVDAVVICTPTVTHGDYIKLAAAHVKHIFVEKPLAATLEEAREIAAFAKSNSLNIQVGFIERFNPAVQALQVVLGKSERLISLDFTRTNKVSARITDVDVITDLMIHDIDLALYLNGPRTVCSGPRFCPRGHDRLCVGLDYPRKRAIFQNSGQPHYRQENSANCRHLHRHVCGLRLAAQGNPDQPACRREIRRGTALRHFIIPGNSGRTTAGIAAV
jgi:hypothetical protein